MQIISKLFHGISIFESQTDHKKEANKPLFLLQTGLYTTKSGAFDKDTKSREHNKKTPKSLENSKKHCNFAK